MFLEGTGRAVTYQEAFCELTSAYDTGHGFETGDSGIEMSPQENPITGSLYDIWYDIWFRERIYHHTGESFETFLDKPRWKMEVQLSKIRPVNKEESRLAENIKSEVEKNKVAGS